MILGRSANLFLGAGAAILNLAFLVSGQLGWPVTPEVAAASNLVLATLIALIANSDTLAVKKGEAASVRLALKGK